MSTSDLIQPTHLQRRAVIYVRQSSPSQVINNQESTRLQYALKKRAIERGWHERDTLVIDTDLGRTGSTAVDRPGFQEMVALVSLGQSGLCRGVCLGTHAVGNIKENRAKTAGGTAARSVACLQA